MREHEGTNIVYHSDNDCNTGVVEIIRRARLRTERECIDLIKGGKTEKELETVEWVFPKLEGYQEEREEEER